MPQISFVDLLTHVVGIAFSCLGAATLVVWLRRRDRSLAYLATALGLLGCVALLGQITSVTGNSRIAQDLSLFAFLGSGCALLAFRNQVIPMRPFTRIAIGAVVLLACGVALLAQFPTAPRRTAPISPFQYAAALLLIAVWAFCVGEPAFRFWRASRGLPVVQRARLRSLSLGYGGIVVVLAVGVAAGPNNQGIKVFSQLGTLLVIPLLYAAFAPPSWLRRRWRRSEEGAYRRATQALVFYSADVHELAETAVDWATRLTGAAGSAIADADGQILAAVGLRSERALEILAASSGADAPHYMKITGTGGDGIVVPMKLEPGSGALLVVAGPYTPFFGAEAVEQLAGYADAVAAALDRVRLNQAIRRQTDRFEQLLNAVSDLGEGLVITEAGRMVYANEAYCKITGYSHEELERVSSLIELAPEREREELMARLAARLRGEPAPNQYEAHIVTRDGREVPIETALRQLPSEGTGRVIALVRDISERKAHLDELEYQSLHDRLTGLPNRALLGDRLNQVILAAQRTGEPFAMLLMDFDHFKEVNDTLGHEAGDGLLRAIAERLLATLRGSDTVARLGGDEFAVLPGSGRGMPGALVTARKIIQALEAPFDVGPYAVDARASIGIAAFPEHGGDPDTLLRCADVAMYVAKRNRSGFAVYTPEEDEHSTKRLSLAGQLRPAVEGGELVLHYQPMVDLARGYSPAAEALVRWRHPEHGLLHPEDFVPLAEETGVINTLARWVLAEALRQRRAWLAEGHDVGISVNLSIRNLQDSDLPGYISGLLLSTGTPAQRLTLELTESSAMSLSAARAMGRLHDLGVRISIDDFGTGYSSLARLKHMPVQELKIDRTFVSDLVRGGPDAAMVATIVSLGHSLGLEVVAEGVEDRRTTEALAACGCDIVQGFGIGRPMPGSEFSAWLRDFPAAGRHYPMSASA